MYLERSILSRFKNWKPNWKLSNIDRVIHKKLPFLGQLRWYSLKPYIYSCNSVNFKKFLIWFSVLKSTHQDASFEIHKSVINFYFFFALAIFFYKRLILQIQKSKFWIFFFEFFFTDPIYNFIWPRVSRFVIFLYFHTAYCLCHDYWTFLFIQLCKIPLWPLFYLSKPPFLLLNVIFSVWLN